jgi:hypothetical protein
MQNGRVLSRSIRRLWLAVMQTMFFICMLSGCSSRPQTDQRLLAVLSDFIFVGAFPYKAHEDRLTELNRSVPLHRLQQQPLPKKLEPGTLYIFHHRRPVDEEKLALTIFPSRLQAAGARNIRAPKSPQELIALFVGGPLFTIQFEYGGREAFIFNSPDHELMRSDANQEWADDDFILVLP